jgi:hypothetical protein
MSKIKKHDEHVSHYAYVTYFKDEGMYKVKASVHVNIEEASKPSKERGYENFHDVTDVDLEFFVNDKKCTYAGFRSIYEELFGKGKFIVYEENLYEEFEAYYLENKVKIKWNMNVLHENQENRSII